MYNTVLSERPRACIRIYDFMLSFQCYSILTFNIFLSNNFYDTKNNDLQGQRTSTSE